jgi:uncharacterized membrane protein/protein-disulfide isomerase
MNKKQHLLSYQIYFYSTVGLVFTGISISLYLVYLHYRTYTDFAYSSFCALSKSINCDTVAQSPWSVIADLPVSVWGFFGYLFYLLILFSLKKLDNTTDSAWSFLVVLGLLFSLASLFLGYISSFIIHAYCILCICIYAVNLSLFYITFIARKRFRENYFLKDLFQAFSHLYEKRKFLTGLILLGLFVISTKFFLPHYWSFELAPLSTDISTGTTESGHPWIGAENPTLIIEEYADYQCFQCAKTHYMFRRLIEKSPTTLRLVFRHYPMDHEFNPTVVREPFHVGSGKMALLAIYAMTQNKFWEMNDALFQLARSKQSFNTRFLSEKTGIPSPELVASLSHPDIQKQLNQDIHRGMKLRITGTPAFVIDGKVYTGSIPSTIIKKIMQ